MEKSQIQKKAEKKEVKKLKPIPFRLFRAYLRHIQSLQKQFGPTVEVVDSRTGKLVKRRRGGGDIPYGYPQFFKGTQAPVFRLRYLVQTVTTSAGNAYVSTFDVTAGNLNNFTDIANMWDEYRVLRGVLEYYPQFFVSGANQVSYSAFGVIDYEDNTALSSEDQARAFDTCKIFNMVDGSGLHRKTDEPAAVWPLKFEKLPDQDWLPTSTTNQKFAYWKGYSTAAQQQSTITKVGILGGYVDVQVRGMSP